MNCFCQCRNSLSDCACCGKRQHSRKDSAMKALLQKIRQLLRDRRFRRIWYRSVSSIAALVVFVTTYALVLPAITMESQAACGIEAHQHDDSCYAEKLACDLDESEGHRHDDTCYSVTEKAVCEKTEHQHSYICYDMAGNLVCGTEEHTHGTECRQEVRDRGIQWAYPYRKVL